MKIIMIVLQVLGGLSLIPWFAVAGLSFMAFDAPKATRRLTPWLFVVGIYLYPFIVGISYWRAWGYFSLGSPKGAILWSCIPLIVFIISYFVITQTSSLMNKIGNRKFN